MATNWTMAQATKEILAGNKEAILDIGKRFPLTATAIAAMGKNEGALTIISALPEHITARKIESVLKYGVVESAEDDVEETEVAEEKPVKKAPAKKEKAAEKKPAKKVKEVEEEDDEETEEEQDYSEMTAMELFKLCKSRKIKVEPKQKAAVYIKALKAADAAAANDDADDDWEEEEEAPKKKPAKKPAAKPAKEEDEEDDWDI